MKNSGAPESSRGGRGSSIPELRRRISSFHKRLRQWLNDSSNLFFALLIVLHLLPIWSFKYFPSQDGPAHINNANILREYYRPDHPIFREYYVLNTDGATEAIYRDFAEPSHVLEPSTPSLPFRFRRGKRGHARIFEGTKAPQTPRI